jgi:hypothetical protein
MSYEQLIEDLNNIFIQFRENLIPFIPQLVFALIIIAVGILVARLFRVLVTRLIKNLDKLAISKKYQNRISQIRLDESALFVGRVVFWIIFAFFLTAATEVLSLPIITAWLSGLVNYLPNILVAAIIILMGFIGGRVIRDLIISATAKAGMLHGDVLGKIAQYTIVLITILIAVDQVGIDIAVLIGVIDIVLAAILFAAALAFGLGARTSISNILASYYLQSRYQEGQFIKIAEIKGKIIQITPTSVIIETSEGQISIPAKKFSEEISTLLKNES